MGQCDLIPIHTVHRADQIGHTVDDCDMRLLSTESARIAELRDAAAWKHCAWAWSGPNRGIASPRSFGTSLPMQSVKPHAAS